MSLCTSVDTGCKPKCKTNTGIHHEAHDDGGKMLLNNVLKYQWKIDINATWCRLTPCCCKTPSQIPAILATITSQSSLVGWVGAAKGRLLDLKISRTHQELILI
jgi:hypothetical protein